MSGDGFKLYIHSADTSQVLTALRNASNQTEYNSAGVLVITRKLCSALDGNNYATGTIYKSTDVPSNGATYKAPAAGNSKNFFK